MELFVNVRLKSGKERDFRPESMKSEAFREYCEPGIKTMSLCLAFPWKEIKPFKPDARRITLHVEGNLISAAPGTIKYEHLYVHFYGLKITGYHRSIDRIAFIRSAGWMHVFRMPFLFDQVVEDLLIWPG